jgi:L-asparaginase type I
MVHLLPTGGTISERSTGTGAVPEQGSIDRLLSQLSDLGIDVRIQETMIGKGSANFTPSDWIRISEIVTDALQKGTHGIVILHGTDTMHYTAAALSFMLSGLNLPVVLTGSMIPGGDSASDALFNLRNAILVAAFADLAEVSIVFSADPEKHRGVILRGSRARKIHSVEIDAFTSVNIPPLGYISQGRILRTQVESKRRGEGKVKLLNQFNTNVVFVKGHPALTGQTLRRFLEGASGAVLEGTGAGHIRNELVEEIASFGQPVVMSTQTLLGGVKWGMYATDVSYLQTKNLISAGDMTSETALVKLMWALGQGGDVRATMHKNMAGELTETLIR